MTNWDNSSISFILQTSKWMKEKEATDFLPESISLIRKLTGAYTTLQVIFEDKYTARIKNATPLFLDDFIFDPVPVKTFIEENNFEPVYWKNVSEHNDLFSDILLALSSAVLIPVIADDYHRLVIIGWSEPQLFNSTFHNFISVVKTRLEEIIQLSRSHSSIQKDNNRLRAIMYGLEDAIVFIDNDGLPGWINKKAAELLQLSADGIYEPDVLATAMASLRNNTINKEEINKTAAMLLTSVDGSIKDWKWNVGGPLNKELTVSCVPVAEKNLKGKLWTFK